MTLPPIFVLSVLALAQNVKSFAFEGPRPTATEEALVAHLRAMSPKPTDPPLEARNIFRRAIASADTCGWLWDPLSSSSSLLGCDPGKTCAVYTSGTRMQGCCRSGYSACGFATTCYDYSQYQSGRCGSSCQTNDLNLVCSNAASRYCQTYTWLGTLAAVGYGCEDNSASTATTVSTVSTGLTFTTTAYVSTAPLRALYSSSTYTRSSLTRYPASTYTLRSGGSSSSSYTGEYRSSVAPLVVAIIVLVLLGLWYVAAVVIIVCTCRRHRRFKRNLNNQRFNRGVSVMPVGAPMVAAASTTNPLSSMSTMSFPQQQAGIVPTGAPASHYSDTSKGMSSPQPAPAYPVSSSQDQQPGSSPAPQYTQQASAPQGAPAPAPAPYSTPPPNHAYAYPAQPYQAPPGQPPVHLPVHQPPPANNVHEMG